MAFTQAIATNNSESIEGYLQDGLDGIFGIEYMMLPDRYREVYEVRSSTRQFEEHLALSGFANAQVKKRGQSAVQLSAGQRYKARYFHQTISAYFAIEQEALEDGRYGPISARYLKALAMSMKEAKEIIAWSVINQAYNTDAPSGDGKPILAADHPLKRGTWSNILGNAGVDMTDESVKALLTLLPKQMTFSGQFAGIRANKLVVPNNLQFVANEILTSVNKAGSMDNGINTIRTLNMFPGGIVVSEYLTHPDRWFVTTNAPDGLIFYERKGIENKMEGDFFNDDVRFRSRERYSAGISDNLGLAGPPIS